MCSTLSAQDYFKLKNTELSLLNDSWGGGFTRIQDDLRSYGLNLKLSAEKHFFLQARLSALTNRFPFDSLKRGRTDELLLRVGFPMVNFADSSGYISLQTGVYLNGNMLGSRVQQYTHEAFGVPEVQLSYIGNTALHPLAGGYMIKELMGEWLAGGSRLSLGLELHTECALYYALQSSIGFPFQILDKTRHCLFSVQGGARLNQIFTANNVVRQVLMSESGYYASMRVNLKGACFFYEIFPGSSYSWGGIGLYLRPGCKDNAHAETEIGMLSKGYGYNFKYLLPFDSLGKHCLYFVIQHNFHSLLKTYLPNYPEVMGHTVQIGTGAELELFRYSRFKLPISGYMNMLPGLLQHTIYAGTRYIEEQRAWHYCVSHDAGIKIRPAIFKKHLGLSLFHRLLWLDAPKQQLLTSKTNNPDAEWQSRWGGAFIFSF